MDITKTQFAKLVLGYLKIEKCHIAYNTFLSTSPYLKEYVNPTKRRHLITRILGLSLHDILEEFSKIYTIIQEHLEDTNYFNESNHSHLLHDQLVYLLEVDVQTRQSTPQRSLSVEIIPNASEDELVGCSPPKQMAGSEGGKSDVEKTEDSEDNETHLSIQAITDTLLKHPEFQEKIAENINKVRLSEGAALDTPEKLQSDIDSAIKAVLEKTQNDPMFETLMGEIIAADEEMVFDNEIESRPQPTSQEPPPLALLTPVIPQQQQQQQLQAQIMDDQIKVAVDSIVTASQQSVDSSLKMTTENRLTVNTNNDIIFYDGTIDNYMLQQQESVNHSPQMPPLVLNNLVMMTSTPAHQANTADCAKSYYLVSGPPYVNVAQPPPPPPPQSYFVSNKVLTERDILSMPTVILNDDKGKSVETNQKPKPPPPTKKKSEDALTEYLTFNNGKVKPKAIIHVEVLQEEHKNDEVAPQPPIEAKAAATTTTTQLPTSDTAKKTPESKGGRRSGVTTPRSTNKSHVRALDFKFQTPSKEVVEVRKATSPKVSTARSLFGSKSKSPKKRKAAEAKKSWDADLRASVPDATCNNVKRKKKAAPQRSKSKPQPNLNKTEDDAKQIENNLHLEEKLRERRDSEKANGNGVDLQEVQQNEKIEEAAAAAVKETCEEEEVKVEEPAKQQQPPTTRGTRSKKQQKCAGKANVTVQLIENENQVHEIALRNFNAKPRFHRKCNIENNTKFKRIADKETPVVVPTPTTLDSTPPPAQTATSSPYAVVDVDSNSLPVLSIPETSSFATPETLKSLTEGRHPVSAGRDITPILETPCKEGICPKTPGRTPATTAVETPFTKVFNEQMEGIDISCIQTPQLTPFPITPFIHGETPYSNRPTDYSTSSSYYQPSDTEQNKSLEMQIIEECRRNESKRTPLHAAADADKSAPVPPPADEQAIKHKVIAEKMKALSSNVIGRKNLSMIPKVRKGRSDEDEDNEEEEEEESDDSTSSSSSCENDSSSCSSSSSGETYKNRTVLEVKDETRYSLRSTRQQQNNDEIKSILSQVNVKEELTGNSTTATTTVDGCDSTKQQVLRELDEKRRRTIAKIKNESTPNAEKGNRKQAKVKSDATTPVSNQNATPKRVLRSTKAKKKEATATVEPMQLVETELLCSNSSDCCEANVPVESKKMLIDMKEMGFPLVPNKFLKGAGVDSCKNNDQTQKQDVPPKQQIVRSPDLNNSNEENKLNAQNVQKPNSHKVELYSLLFGTDDDGKEGEGEKSKTTTTTVEGGKQKSRQRRRPSAAKKLSVQKIDDDEDKTVERQVQKRTAKNETSKSRNDDSKRESKSAKSKRTSKTAPKAESKDVAVVVVDKSSEKTASEPSKSSKSTKKSEEKTTGSKVSKSQSGKSKSEKSDKVKITGESESKNVILEEVASTVKDVVDVVVNTASGKDVKEHADAVECLKKSEEDKVMDKTKVIESKTADAEDPTISKGVVCNGGAKQEPKIIKDDAKVVVESKTITEDVVAVVQLQQQQNEPYDDEFDRSLICSETHTFCYVETDPPTLPDVQLPLDTNEKCVFEVINDDDQSLPVLLQKVTVSDFWHVDPKPTHAVVASRKRRRNVVEVLDDVSVTPVKMVTATAATTTTAASEKEEEIGEEEPPKKKYVKHHKIEDVVDDLKRLKSEEEELLKEVDVDIFLDKLHGA